MTFNFRKLFRVSKFGIRILKVFSRIFFPLKHLSKRNRRLLVIFSIAIIAIILPIAIYTFTHLKSAEAAWFNTNWGFREAINITAHPSAETNVYLNLTGGNALNTSDTTRFQADCGDLRFTDANGKLLPYYIVSGCGSSSTVVHVFMQNFPSGAQTIYYYYGNPSASNGFSTSDFSTAASGVTIGSFGSEEVGAAPVAYWKFDEGTGTTANDSSSNNKNLTFSGTASWASEDQCISGKCLKLDGTNNAYTYNSSFDFNVMKSGQETANWTLSAWAKPNGTQAGGERVIIGRLGCHGGLYANATSIDFAIKTTGCWTNYAHVLYTPPDMNSWHYYTAVYNNRNMYLYVDGKLVGTSYFSDTISAYGNTIYVGGIGTYVFNGFIDEPKVYNYARSSTQVKADFNARGGNASGVVLGGSDANKNLSNGLVGYWKMDESSGAGSTLADSSGNGNTGTASLWGGGNTATDSAHVAGKFGNSFSFDGGDDYINAGNPSVLNPSQITVAAWVQKTSGSGYRRIIEKQYTNSYYLGLDATGTHFQGIFANSVSPYGTLISTTTISNGVWYHIVITHDGSIDRLYVNGNLEATQTNTTTLNNTTNSVTLGKQASGNGAYWNGLIDEARIYKRALSPAEVSQLYNYAPGPVGYWKMDEHSGQTVNDSSGNGNNGYLGSSTNPDSNDTVWTQGKYGSALKGDGTAKYATVTSASTKFGYQSSFTIEAWFKKFANKSLNSIYFQQGTCGTGNFQYGISGNSNGTISASVGKTCTAQNAANSGVLNNNQWYHATLTYNGTAVSIYINGVYITSTNYSLGAVPDADTGAMIGSDSGDPTGRSFNGTVDEVKIYNYARTQKQIVSDMNGGHPAGGSPVGSQIGYWKFDEGYGTVANNSGNGGNALKGTLYSTTWRNEGKFGKALAFNGTASYVDTPQPTQFSKNSFTNSFWLNINNPALNQSVLSEGAWGAGGRGWNIGFFSADTWWGAKTGYINFSYQFVGGGTIAITKCNYAGYQNKWVYITAVRDFDAQTAALYLNGVKCESNYYSNMQSTETNDYQTSLKIGRDGWTAADYLSGIVDEVKVYNYALTADEIKLDYNRGATQVLGSMSDTSGLTGGQVASNSASAAYCIPGDTSTCSSPVGEWNFEEGQGTTTNDTSGNGNTGILNANTAWKTGKIGKGLSFDGSGDYVSTSNTTSTQVTSGTMEAWIKTSNAGTSYRGIIVKQNAYGMFLKDNVFIIYDWGGGGDRTTSVNLADNKWHHVVVTFQSGTTNGTILYVDGVAKLTTTMTIVNQNQSMSFGTGNSTANGQDFNGLMDQVRLFYYARTPAQVAWDYNRGAPVAYWKLDECQGTIAHDSSGNGNNGTITIGATGTQTSAGTCTTAGTAWGNGATGKYNASLKFDGADDYVNAGSNIKYSNGVTYSAWIKPVNTTADLTFIRKFSDTFRFGSSNKLEFTIDGTDWGGHLSTKTISTGVWTHIVATFDDSSNTLKYYINGNLDSSQNYVASITTSGPGNYPTYIGANSYPGQEGTNPFNGQIDDVRIYNYPLTPSQVKQVMNQGAGVRFGPNTGTP